MINVRGQSSRRWICTDCARVFTVYGRLQRRPYCVQCGDCISTKKYYQPIANAPRWRGWSADEFERAKQLRAAGSSFSAIGTVLGRTKKSVKSKFDRELPGKE